MLTDKQLREYNRYRDIGSGTTWMPLPKKILDFIFNETFNIKLLTTLGINTFRDISWDSRYGIGMINNSHQLRILVAQREDIKRIRKKLSEVGNMINLGWEQLYPSAILTSKEIPSIDTAINDIIEVLSTVVIGRIHDFKTKGSLFSNATEDFINTHIKEQKYFLRSESTNSTGKNDILLYSIPMSEVSEIINPSSSDAISKEKSDAYKKIYGTSNEYALKSVKFLLETEFKDF